MTGGMGFASLSGRLFRPGPNIAFKLLLFIGVVASKEISDVNCKNAAKGDQYLTPGALAARLYGFDCRTC